MTVAFTGSYNETQTGVTDGNGVVVLTTNATVKRGIAFTATVTNVTHATLPYNPSANVMDSASF